MPLSKLLLRSKRGKSKVWCRELHIICSYIKTFLLEFSIKMGKLQIQFIWRVWEVGCSTLFGDILSVSGCLLHDIGKRSSLIVESSRSRSQGVEWQEVAVAQCGQKPMMGQQSFGQVAVADYIALILFSVVALQKLWGRPQIQPLGISRWAWCKWEWSCNDLSKTC